MYIRERRLQIVARVQMLLASSGESAVSRRACCRKSVLSVECVASGVCWQLSVLSVECIVSGVLSVEYVVRVR